MYILNNPKTADGTVSFPIYTRLVRGVVFRSYWGRVLMPYGVMVVLGFLFVVMGGGDTSKLLAGEMLMSLGADSSWQGVEAYAQSVIDGNDSSVLGISSAGQPGDRNIDDQQVTVRFSVGPDGLQLAAFSDDGVTVSVLDLTEGNPNTHIGLERKGKGQGLPFLQQSLHPVDYTFQADHEYEITVDYLNTYYTGEGDIDGAQLIAYNGTVGPIPPTMDLDVDTNNDGHIAESNVASEDVYEASEPGHVLPIDKQSVLKLKNTYTSGTLTLTSTFPADVLPLGNTLSWNLSAGEKPPETITLAPAPGQSSYAPLALQEPLRSGTIELMLTKPGGTTIEDTVTVTLVRPVSQCPQNNNAVLYQPTINVASAADQMGEAQLKSVGYEWTHYVYPDFGLGPPDGTANANSG